MADDKSTTVQISRDTASLLRGYGDTYESAIRYLIPAKTHTIILPRNGGDKIPSGKYVFEEERIPFDGIITVVVFSSQPGAQSFILGRLLYHPPRGGVLYIIPAIDGKFITSTGRDHTFEVSIPVKAGGILRAEWKNKDSANDHYSPFYITLRRSVRRW